MVVGERIVHELRGVSCPPLEEVAPQRTGCAVTRCFSGRVADLATLEEAVAAHATRLGEKLRRHGVATDAVTVFFHTSTHDHGPQHDAPRTMHLPEATSDRLRLVAAAKAGGRGLAEGLPLFEVRGGDGGPGAARDAPRPLLDGIDHERSAKLMGARRGERPLGPRRPGAGRDRPQAAVVHQVRLAWRTLHHANGRVAKGHLLRRVERLIEDRRPNLIVVDEAWKALDISYFAERLSNCLVTARKANCAVVMMT